MSIRVYCDTGADLKKLKTLESLEKIILVYFPYEQKTNKIKTIVTPTSPGWSQMNLSWDECNFKWDDLESTDTFRNLISNGIPRIDAQHLDSAFKACCKYFVTSDKGDIFNKKALIKEKLGFDVLHNNDLSILEDL